MTSLALNNWALMYILLCFMVGLRRDSYIIEFSMGIETTATAWQSSAPHLAQLASTCANPLDAEKNRARKPESTDTDKIVNIICHRYNSKNIQNAECTYSKEGCVCNKGHVCLSFAKRGLCYKHTEGSRRK